MQQEQEIKLQKNSIRFYASAEEQELHRLKEAINRTDTEKFYFLMNLMKMQQTMKKGRIEFKK